MSQEDFAEIKGKRSDSRSRGMNNNDPLWYAKDQQLLIDAASIPFSWAAGVPLSIPGSNIKGEDWTMDSSTVPTAVPGVCALHIAPTLGYSNSITSAINVAANSIYSYVRHANSGAKNYDSTNMMMYLYCMANVYSAINWCTRIYSEAVTFSQRNRYYPGALLRAEGFAPEGVTSVMNNLANYRMRLNVAINKAASFAVPSTMPIFQRLAFLFKDIYIEGDSMKEQSYMYVPDGFYYYTYDTAIASKGYGNAYLKYMKTSEAMSAWNEPLEMLEGMLNQIFDEEDIQIMSGDILKAYGIENCLKLQEVSETQSITPIYSVEVLEQMMNADIISNGSAELQNNIYERIIDNGDDVSGFLFCECAIGPFETGVQVAGDTTMQSVIAGSSMSHVLNTYKREPNQADVMVSSRLKSVISEEGMTQVMGPHASVEGTSTYLSLRTGSDFCTKVELWIVNYADQGDFEQIVFGSNYMYVDNLIPSSAHGDWNLQKWISKSAFHYFPICYSIYISNSATAEQDPAFTYRVTGVIGDVDNFAVLSLDNIRNLHDIAMLSMFNVPVINIVK
nr:capsid protein [Chicken picobirnavirus]